MATQVDICNMALANIGAKGDIASIDEGSVESRRCLTYYDNTRDIVLRDFHWNFATTFLALSLSGTAVGDWSYSYAWPANCIKFRNIHPATSGVKVKYEIVFDPASGSKYINTDEEDAVGVYTYQVADELVFDELFVEAFAWKLAARLALPVTRSAQAMREAERTYQLYLSNARATSADEEDPHTEALNDISGSRA